MAKSTRKIKVGNMNVTNSGNLKNKLTMNDNELELPEDFEAGNISADNVKDVSNEVEFSGSKVKSKWVWLLVAIPPIIYAVYKLLN